MAIHGEILLETCVTVNSANNNSRRKRFLVMASLRKTTKCNYQKQYYKEPRHSKLCSLRNSIKVCMFLSLIKTPNTLIYNVIAEVLKRLFIPIIQKQFNCKL